MSRRGAEADTGPDQATRTTSGQAFPIETEDFQADSLFGDWEPAVAPEAPPDNPAFAVAEVRRQQRINEHEPIDSSFDWSDFEADLPDFAKLLPSVDDAEHLAALRRVLLLAAREGSVPRIAVEDLLSERGDADARDHIAEAQLQVVIGGIAQPNDASVALHERLGFEKVAMFKRVGRKFDQWIDVGYWQLQLA